jgi:hypothetical protein
MRETARRVIILVMSRLTELVLGGSLLRKAWLVAAVLAALVAGIVAFDQSADATSYEPDDLQVLRLINN